jgi:hypothetical protein
MGGNDFGLSDSGSGMMAARAAAMTTGKPLHSEGFMRKTISILTLAALAAVVPAQVQARAACAARWPVRWRAIMPVIMPWGLWAAVSPRAPITSTRQPRPRSGILRPRLHRPSLILAARPVAGRADPSRSFATGT